MFKRGGGLDLDALGSSKPQHKKKKKNRPNNGNVEKSYTAL